MHLGNAHVKYIPELALQPHEVHVRVDNKDLYLPLNFHTPGIDIPWLRQVKKSDDLRIAHVKRHVLKLLRAWQGLCKGADQT